MEGGGTYNIIHTSIGTRDQHDQANEENSSIDSPPEQILGRFPTALFLNEHEPHQSGEVEGETGDEEGGGDGEQVFEEGNDLGDDKSDDSDEDDERQPGDPAHLCVDKTDNGVLEDAAVEQTAQDDGVDGATDEDDGKGDTKGDSAHQMAGGFQGGTPDILADESIDQSTSQGVDEDLNQTQGPDRFDVVFGGVHLVHEGKLTHGKTVGKDNVGNSDEGFGKSGTLLGPSRPIDGSETTRRTASFNPGSDDGDTDGGEDGGKIDITQDSNLSKTRGDGEQNQDDHGDDSKDYRADTALGDALKGNGPGQTVRAREKGQLEDEHDIDEFVAKTTQHQSPSIGIVMYIGEEELDLTDDVTGVDSDEPDPDGTDDPRHHAQGRERRGNGQTPQSNGLDNEHDGQSFPTQTVEFVNAMVVDISFSVTDLTDTIPIEHFGGFHFVGKFIIIDGFIVGDIVMGDAL